MAYNVVEADDDGRGVGWKKRFVVDGILDPIRCRVVDTGTSGDDTHARIKGELRQNKKS